MGVWLTAQEAGGKNRIKSSRDRQQCIPPFPKPGKDGAAAFVVRAEKSKGVSRSLNRKRGIAFYHLLLEIWAFVLAPEFCSVSNPIENGAAVRLVLANDGTGQADEVCF
jgi:hypothetical protein